MKNQYYVSFEALGNTWLKETVGKADEAQKAGESFMEVRAKAFEEIAGICHVIEKGRAGGFLSDRDSEELYFSLSCLYDSAMKGIEAEYFTGSGGEESREDD